jgi:hypothetical protein
VISRRQLRENDDSATVLEAMKRREVRRIPVTNERGGSRRSGNGLSRTLLLPPNRLDNWSLSW